MLNFYWDINKIKMDLNAIDNKISIATGNKVNLFLSKMSLLNALSTFSSEYMRYYEKNYSSKKIEKIRQKFETNFEKEILKIFNIIINNRQSFINLFSSIENMRFIDFDETIEFDNTLDKNALKSIRLFFESYDHNLLKYFDYLYKNNCINVNDDDIGEYNGYCIDVSELNKQYIQINKFNPMPVICHEVAHAFESRIDKKTRSWNYGINIYNEVFAIIITILSDNFLLNTEYRNNSIIDQIEFLETVHTISKELVNEMNQKLENFSISDFTYNYDANIALALAEQYLIDKKDGKRNIEYFINNCDVDFSNKLLKSVDIDLKKLYSGGYYLDYYKKVKKLTR